MTAEYVGHRVSVHADGNLYLARDLRVVEDDGRVRFYPQHAEVRTFTRPGAPAPFDRLVWIGHQEGGPMGPLIEAYEPDVH